MKARLDLGLPLETARLLIRPLGEADVPGLRVLDEDEGVKRFTGGVVSEEETRDAVRRIEARFRSSGSGPYPVLEAGLQQVERIFALVDPDNRASERVVQKIGLRYLRDMYHEPSSHEVRLYGIELSGKAPEATE